MSVLNQPCPSCGQYEVRWVYDVVPGPRVTKQVRYRGCWCCDWEGPLVVVNRWRSESCPR